MTRSIDWETIKAAIAAWVIDGSGVAEDAVIWDYQGPQRPAAPWISLEAQSVFQKAHDYLRKEANPLIFADLTVASVDVGGNRLQITGHGLTTADGPVQLTGIDLPTPLSTLTDYWVVVLDANHVRLTDSFARSGGNNVARGLGSTPNPISPITVTTTGSGTIHLTKTAETVRAGREIKRTSSGIRELNVQLQCFAADDSGTDAIAILSDIIASLPHHVYELDLVGVGISSIGAADVEGGIKATKGSRGGILEPRAIITISVYLSSELVGYTDRADRVKVTPAPTLESGDEVTLDPLWIPSPP